MRKYNPSKLYFVLMDYAQMPTKAQSSTFYPLKKSWLAHLNKDEDVLHLQPTTQYFSQNK